MALDSRQLVLILLTFRWARGFIPTWFAGSLTKKVSATISLANSNMPVHSVGAITVTYPTSKVALEQVEEKIEEGQRSQQLVQPHLQRGPSPIKVLAAWL